jgi:MoxR-like ATPase
MLMPIVKVLAPAELIALQSETDKVYVDPALIEYAVRIVTATREPKKYGLPDLQKYNAFGASPRASINLILTARGLALVRGRTYVLPQDVYDMVLDVLRHRMVLTYEALSDAVTSDKIIGKVMERIPIPVVPLQEHVKLPAAHGAPAQGAPAAA